MIGCIDSVEIGAYGDPAPLEIGDGIWQNRQPN
jgi:hypothetical protein